MTITPAALYRGAMVGRERQLAHAVSFLSELEMGDSPGILCYWAPAGIGKTRLVREIDANLPEFEFIFLEADQVPGTDPFAEFFRSWFSFDPRSSNESNSMTFRDVWDGLLLNLELQNDYSVHQLTDELRTARPFLESISGLEQSPGSIVHQLEPSQRAEKIKTSITSFFTALSILRPVVMVFENTQWLSRESFLIFERILNAASGYPLAFIATGRPDDDGIQPVFPSNSSFKSEVIFLDGLPRDSITSFVMELNGLSPDEALVEFLWDRAGGVPLFLEQAVDYLTEMNLVIRKRDHLLLSESATDITGSIKDMFLTRIRLMPDSFRRVTCAASVLGKSFDPCVLAHITGAVHIEDELTSGVQMHIFKRDGSSFSFAHVLFREWAIELSSPSKLEKLRLKAGQVLEAQSGKNTSASRFEEIASHFQFGGDNLKAAIYLRKAAGAYAENFENQVAASLYRRLTSILGEPEKTEADLDLADVYKNAGLLKDGIDLLMKTMERICGNALIDDSLKARVMLKLGTNFGSAGNLKQAEEMLRQSLEVFTGNNDIRNMSIAVRQLGMTVRSAGRTEEAVSLVEESIDLAYKSGLPREICASLYWAAITYRLTGQFDLMRKCTEEQVEVAQKSGLLRSIIAGYDNLMRVHIYNRDYDSAVEVHGKLKEAATKTANWAALSTATSKLGIIHLRKGENEKAIECFRSCVTLSQKTGNLRAECAALGNIAGAYIGLEDPDNALTYSTRLIDTSARMGFKTGLMSGYARMGYVFSLKGDYESAIDCIQTQIEHAESLGDSRNLSDGWASIAGIQLQLDETEAAIESVNKALENSRKASDMVLCGSQLELRGKLLVMAERLDEAEKDLLEALELTEGRKGRDKLIFSCYLYLEVIRAAKGEQNASERILDMLEDAPDCNSKAEALYNHWKLTGNPESASGSRILLEEMYQGKQPPIIEKWLESLPSIIDI